MKRKKSGGGGANWMDTYGDMVTLLLCFFVLLFSMSTLDKEKIIQLVRAFNPEALIETDKDYTQSGNNEDPISNLPTQSQESVDEMLAELAQKLEAYADSQNAQSGQNTANGMAVTLGDGYVYIALNDAVFFEGDSYVLLDAGKPVLDEVAAMLYESAAAINEIRVLGHTARQIPTEPNNPITDRRLSTGRAAEVLVYLQDRCGVDPARMIAQGFGEWRPIADNSTPQGRAQNRRVELIVSGITVGEANRDSIAQYYTESGNEPPATSQAPVQPETN